MFLVVNVMPDEGDPFWDEMGVKKPDITPESIQPMDTVEADVSSPGSPVKFADSGLGLLLLCISAHADVTLDVSRESGEISEEDEPDRDGASTNEEKSGKTQMGHIKDDCEWDGTMYNRFSYYVAKSLAERLVLENPPAPVLSGIKKTPNPRVTLITDRVGAGLTRKDKVIYMQNNVTTDYWDLARQVSRHTVNYRFRYIFIMVGLD